MKRRLYSIPLVALVAFICVLPAVGTAALAPPAALTAHGKASPLVRTDVRGAGDEKRACVVTGPRPDSGEAFGLLVNRQVDCVLTYNDQASNWSAWERPWFLAYPSKTSNWGTWNAAVPGRQVIVTQNLFPSELDTTDWRLPGAQGAFASHARALAQNLVAAGLSNAIIRLAHEANGDTYADGIGSTERDFALWRQFWRATVQAMRAVPGADFRFDWTVNAGYRPIPFAKYYPGDDVVDIIGIDAYDSGVTQQEDRWSKIYNKPFGLRDLLGFATAHGKALSIPEWGVAPPNVALSGGDDAAYVDGIASVVRDNRVAYQAYYYAHAWADQLAPGTASLAAYRRHFGAGGDAVPVLGSRRRAASAAR